MRRKQLEHVLRAASTIIGERDIVVVSSQAILGTVADDRLPLKAITVAGASATRWPPS